MSRNNFDQKGQLQKITFDSEVNILHSAYECKLFNNYFFTVVHILHLYKVLGIHSCMNLKFLIGKFPVFRPLTQPFYAQCTSYRRQCPSSSPKVSTLRWLPSACVSIGKATQNKCVNYARICISSGSFTRRRIDSAGHTQHGNRATYITLRSYCPAHSPISSRGTPKSVLDLKIAPHSFQWQNERTLLVALFLCHNRDRYTL